MSIFFAAGLIGDGVFLLGSESDDSEIDVSHSNGMFASLFFFVGLRELIGFG